MTSSSIKEQKNAPEESSPDVYSLVITDNSFYTQNAEQIVVSLMESNKQQKEFIERLYDSIDTSLKNKDKEKLFGNLVFIKSVFAEINRVMWNFHTPLACYGHYFSRFVESIKTMLSDILSDRDQEFADNLIIRHVVDEIKYRSLSIGANHRDNRHVNPEASPYFEYNQHLPRAQYIHEHLLRSYYQMNSIGGNFKMIEGAAKYFYTQVSPGNIGRYNFSGELLSLYSSQYEKEVVEIDKELKRDSRDKTVSFCESVIYEKSYVHPQRGAVGKDYLEIFDQFTSEDPEFYFDIEIISSEYTEISVITGLLVKIIDHNSNILQRRLRSKYKDVAVKENSFDDYLKSNKDTDVAVYKIFSSLDFRQIMFEKFHIDISKISIGNQKLFLEFLYNKSFSDIESIEEFFLKYSEGGLIPFLSLDLDFDMGDKIIKFGVNGNKETISEVFEKYAEIVEQSNHVGESMAAEIEVDVPEYPQVQELRSILMLRAKDVLVDFIEASKLAQERGVVLSDEEIIAKLSKIKADNLLLASALKLMKKNGEQIKSSEIKRLQIEADVSGAELTDDDKEEMKRIYALNYQQYPMLSERLLTGFDEALASEDSGFTMLRLDEMLAGFYRIDTLPDGSVHFASFNVDKEFHGSGIGEAVMLEKIDQIAKEKVMHAECAAYARIGANYIERGFVANSAGALDEVPILNIERDDNNFDFASKKMSESEIQEKYVRATLSGAENYVSEDGSVKILSKDDNAEFNFDDYLKDGYVLTRYFQSATAGDKKWYIALEKKN